MLIALLLSCQYSPFSRDMLLFHANDEKCRGKYPCQVKLSDVVQGDWDRVVFVYAAANPKVVERGAGLRLPPLSDTQDQVLFCRGEEVVKVDTTGIAFSQGGRTAFIHDAEMSEGWALFSREHEFVTARYGLRMIELSSANKP